MNYAIEKAVNVLERYCRELNAWYSDSNYADYDLDVSMNKDCFDKFNKEYHVKSFDSSKENHMILETRKALIYKYRPYDNYADTIISVQEFIGVFSDKFMSDFVLMCAILKLRELNVYSRKVYCMRSRELYYEQDVNTVLEELKEILLRYMPAQYVLSNIVHCLSGNYEEFYDENPGHRVGEAMDCFADTDVMVMELVASVAQSKGSKLLISEKEIEGIYDVWCSNNNPDRMIPVDMYKITMFQEWLAKNCLVST
ncbi:MAG: hypothetical protein IJB96_09250 [Lachnospira sp.]|nr:hypothetical protein [Lachnospira sp.]